MLLSNVGSQDRSSESSDASCSCLTNAYRAIIRDLGNEVSRIEAFDRISIEEAKAESSLQSRYQIPIPLPTKITDLCQLAVELGLCQLCRGCVPTAFSRAIDEYTIEVVIWRSP